MTDEIMINGVDVSTCEFLQETLGITACHKDFSPCNKGTVKEYLCANSPDCYYKQLKRKEEKCELLNTQLESYHIGEPKLVAENEKLNKQLQAEQQKVKELEEKLEFLPYVEMRKEEEKTLRIQLQEENKKLDETINNLLKVQYELAANCQKYTQALEEIKEEINFVYDNRVHFDLRDVTRCKRILDKISEVLND